MLTRESTRRTPAAPRRDHASPPHDARRRAAATRRAPGPRLVCALALASAAFAASCESAPTEVGKPPEGEVLKQETLEQKIARERRERQGGDGEERTVVPPSSDPSRIGVVATHKFHRPGCPDLESVPPGGQAQFRSCWDAINGDYAPCTRCAAGPDPDEGR